MAELEVCADQGSTDAARALTTPAFGAVSGLLASARLLAPSELAAEVAACAHLLGAREAVVYRIDYHQTSLVPMPSEDAADRSALTVDGTLAGKAFTSSRILEGRGADALVQAIPPPDDARPGEALRLWAPLLNGVERIGVLELVFDDPCPPPQPPNGVDGIDRAGCLAYANLVALLLVTKGDFGDVDEYVRRRKPLTIAAELQWRMLPPLTFATDRLTISGVLEPCEAVAGDSFDYAVNGDRAHFAIFDAMGHGLGSTLTAGVALAAYRNGRRALLDLPDIQQSIDITLAEHFGGDRFVTGLLGELDLTRGSMHWLSAGHPPPLLLRNASNIRRLETSPAPPMGLMMGGPSTVATAQLEPGDRIVCYSDGVTEARDTDGAFFGVDRLADFVSRASASGLQAPEVLRRLAVSVLDHVEHTLVDDATIVLIEWSGTPQQELTVGA